MKDIEIEIQVRVENVKPLLDLLQKKGKKVLDDHQIDEYFTPIHRDFTVKKPIDEWLRLRESGEHSITYKNWHHGPDGKTTHADEFESKIESPEQLRKIFHALDIKPVITVNKYRQSWNLEEYEVSIDEIKGLGSFVEVEYKADGEVDPKSITEKMISFLKEVGVGKIERNHVGYPYMLIYPDEQVFEEA